MSRYARKEYRVGDYWLSQRANSPAWYRTHYDEAARQTRRFSLQTDDFDTAKQKLDEWYIAERMRSAQNLSPSEVTLSDLFKDYLDHHAVKLRSYKSVIILLRYWEEFYKEGATIEDVRDVRKQEQFREFLEKKGLAHNSIARCMEAGRAAMRRAYKRNVVASVPFIECGHIQVENPRGRPLSIEDIGRLYSGAADHVRLFLILMLGTGARNEAICTLTWDQIDFENGLIHLNPKGRKQTSKRRPTVKLVPFVREILEPMDKKTPFVIMWRGEGVKQVMIGIRKAVKRAELDRDVTAYSCRHTVARWLRKEGVSPWETAMQLGHKVVGFTMTERYAAWSPDYLEKAAVALEKLLRLSIPLDATPIPSAR
ncbi:tyrosine-type recombinase/integrase [Agrobacterium tumefaciens]|uniref:tyrosine-type recombinase/integrase n=1 Tax=Agrobacterium tumefaciens TaxID=358 RepID=UPI000980FD20|nr:site-specific integrase [Agrobacterium tumefaciens]